MNKPELPPPPPQFFGAVKRARRIGFWIKCARFARPGESRFIITAPHGSDPLFGSDSIEDVLGWLRARERRVG